MMHKESLITKKCEICGKVKPIEEFSKSYRNRCKQCVAEQTRVQRGLNKIQKKIVPLGLSTISLPLTSCLRMKPLKLASV